MSKLSIFNFTIERTPTIMDGVVYRIYITPRGGEVNASRNGFSLDGYFPVYRDPKLLTKVINFAAYLHTRLRDNRDFKLTQEHIEDYLRNN